jgi:hypothetical protein
MTYLVEGHRVFATNGHSDRLVELTTMKDCRAAIQEVLDDRPDVKHPGLKCVEYRAH